MLLSRTGKTVAAVVLIAIVVGVAILMMNAKAPPDRLDRPQADVKDADVIQPPPDLSPEKRRLLLNLHHLGLALLENGEYLKSEPLLIEAWSGRHNVAAVQNLAICQILALGEGEINSTDAAKQAQVKRAQDTIGHWQKIEERFASRSFIAGKLEVLKGDIAAAVALFRRESESPVHQYAIYEAIKNKPSAELIPIGAEALKQAHTLVPDNLWVLCELLINQLERQDEAIAHTIERADEAFEFLKPGILKRTRLDLDQSFDAAHEALRNADWTAAAGQIRRVVNVTRPEVAVQLDRGKVSPHLLEFVQFDVGLSAPHDTSGDDAEPIAVKLVPQATDVAPLNIPGLKMLHLVDFDLDGKLDIVAATDRVVHVLSRAGESNDWTSSIAYESSQPISGVVLVDLDRDANANTVTDNVGCATADVDVITFGAEGVQILLNEITDGLRQLSPVAQSEAFQQLRGVLTVAAVDFDHEGDLDLVVSSDSGLSFWTNLGNMEFEKLERRAELPPDDFLATQILAFDENRDVTPELLLWDGNARRIGWMINLRHGEFRWKPGAESGVRSDNKNHSSRMLIADFNSDARWDVVVGDAHGIVLHPDIGRSVQNAENTSWATVNEQAAKDMTIWDYDNDGKLDLIAAGDDGLTIWRGNGRMDFSAVDDVITSDRLDSDSLQNIQRLDVGDIDADGDIDVVAATGHRILLFRNDGGNKNHWLDVALRAQPTPDRPQERINIHGLGSVLDVRIDDEYQTQIVTRPVTHFGLGKYRGADVVRLVWPNGLPYSIIDPPANVAICEEQRLLSSCAFLYAWNGERFDFITDLLWNAPIGLPIAEGVYIPPREWEYLHIPGERLQPQDGFYTVQVTEELWEAAYFDEIELIAVDHPAGVEIVSNEKVGPPSVAEYKLHTVSERRVPVRAANHRGRDLLPELLNEDDRYAQPFDRRIKQGLVEEHFVELDLGELDNPQQITLFLRGWMYPTGPSVNIAISQNPDITMPKPPALSVPDADGEWKEVIPFTGFPGGKAKTIAIDLSQAFLTDDYRVRLSTNMEFYWDSIYFTVDEPAVQLVTFPLPMASADLHFRGLSRMTRGEQNGPEFFDYDRVITEPFWSPMQGKFTRFGDVKELLIETDDELLVMGAGDEVTIRWEVPDEPLPEGWKRDFILLNVGWNKDDDLNTAYGHQVEPLPFVGMEHYPYDEIPEQMQSPDYLEYLKTYQTRVQTRRFLGHHP